MISANKVTPHELFARLHFFEPSRIVYLCLSFSILCSFAKGNASAQAIPRSSSVRKDTARIKAGADNLATDRIKQAHSILITLASEAGSFRDQKLRARSLARIADTLWEVDPEQSRSLFRKSWEAGETADADSGSYNLGEEPSNLRREILTLVAKRDRSLAEEFLQKLEAAQEATITQPVSETRSSELPAALQQRLNLAENLVRSGDIKRALEFADMALGNVSTSTLDFLTLLRDKDPVAADTRYTIMLRQTGSNPLADANAISLLASYVFTPRMYVTFNRQGGADASWTRTIFPPANVSPQLRLMFFQVAHSVLSRPSLPPDQDQTTTGIPGKFMVVRRLMPLFEQYGPAPLADAMRGQLEALNALVSEGVRASEKEWAERGIAPEKSLAAQEEPLLDQVERANSSDERDALYFKLASVALSKDDQNARNYVSKIADAEFRQQAQRWIDWALAVRAIKKKKADTALELARTVELSHLQRVWILTQSAKLLVSIDREKSLSVLEQALAESRRLESSEDRPRALLAIANAVMVIEPTRVWDTIFEAVKAANSSEGFSGEDGLLSVSINNKKQILAKKFDYVPDFEIKGIFSEIAKKDFDRAVQLAHGFQREAARANATIAICRHLLNDKLTRPLVESSLKN
ncbi:MAG TPA: hypothetical protein VJT69_18655 [Pyrinomonadaceae bacterium]|nr:hypothetical protein [Pyrinomonadaceae bacterium]